MAYSTAADVRSRIKSIGNTGDYTDAAIATHIARADNRLNARLAQLYDGVPFSSTPPLVADMSADLAAAYVLRFAYPPQTGAQGSTLADTYESGVFGTDQKPGVMDQLASGELNLIGADGTAIDRLQGAYAATIKTPDTPYLDRDDMNDTFTLEP
ncbi:MAG TPA: hypothetical protein VFK80_02880 [Limnochordia bacterium]|nr:hypothetical protein [Limnochordia bacterium]